MTRYARVVCATWGLVYFSSVQVWAQVTNATQTGPCRPEDLKEIFISDWTFSGGPYGTNGLDSFGWSVGPGGGIGRVECRIKPL